MEAPEEFGVSNDHQTQMIIRRKRTKRPRSSSPFGLAMTSSSSSGCGGGGASGGEREVVEDYGSTSSPTTSGEIYESTEEEEDMANCLIMLAQGEGPKKLNHNEKIDKSSARKFSNMANSTSTNKAGFFVYECKTCNRSFPSFQALGGHRASHKKPKASIEEKKSQVITLKEVFEDGKFNTNSPPLALQLSNNKVSHVNKGKIHECSICGAEFTSGQALGGHMRRHRAAVTTNQVGICIDTTTNLVSHSDEIKPRNILALDLNLPAPEDDHRSDTKFQFGSTQPPSLMFSAPALVDCHY
ncbi:zf-C2H2_6 domain-containing protein [Cephalotus follicularis]|uniref:Zf-C2H2_6 domain-containing protein n=1 Tax=Cephalotus follicularis TaxID=3775 RepID=A0A1Q3BQ05_CEPFO|nr:zf-C2H2_6 domain-containing protein [Cephalotus follicularis]